MLLALSRLRSLGRGLTGAALVLASLAASPAQAQVPERWRILGVEGDHFTIDGTPKFLTMLSYFDAMRIADDAALRDDLSFIKYTLGFDGIRVFPNWWIYDPAQPPCPKQGNDTLFDASGAIRGDAGGGIGGRLLALVKLLRAAEDTGLVVDLSFARETVPGGMTVENYQRALQRTAFLLREYRLVLFDIQNERDQSDTPFMLLTHDQTRDIKNAIKDTLLGDPARLVTASMGGTPYNAVSPDDPASAVGFAAAAQLDILAHHDARGANWQTETTTVVNDLRNGPRPVYLQEPTRWRMATNACGGAETSDQSDGNTEHFRTALRLAKAARAAAWTLHTQRAFRLNGPNGRLRTQLEALPPAAPERELLMGVGSIPKLTVSDDPTPWPITVTLSVQIWGPGTVTSAAIPGAACGGPSSCSINCTSGGGMCSVDAPVGSTVVLMASPQTSPPPAARFDGWDVLTGGDESPCPYAEACTLTLDLPRDIGARFSVEPPETVELYHPDAVGTVRAVTSLSGGPTVKYEYLPFGELYSGNAPNDPLTSTRLFAGKERDVESGLDYFGARYLRSRSARFTSLDPVLDSDRALLNPQHWNRYAYSLNNPLRYEDTDGRSPTIVTGVIGGVIGGVAGLVGSVGAQLVQNGGNFSEINWRDAGASAAGGAVSGAVAGLTLGTSLVVQAGVGGVVAVGAGTNVLGGVITRSLDSSSETRPGDAREIGIDLVAGVAGSAVGLAAEARHAAGVPQMVRQQAAMQAAAKGGGSGAFGASRGAAGMAAKVARVRTQAEIVSNIAGAKVSNVVVPIAREVKKRKDNDSQ
jgi:RHS repeat-associated protein